MSNKRLQKSLREIKNKKQDVIIPIAGELGIPLGGQKLVEVPNRQGFVFVRLKNNTSELIQAYNASVSPVYDLPVLVVRANGVYKVVGRNETRNQNQWGLAPYLPKHGAQHSFNPSINVGGDIVWVYSQQFMPLLGYPSGSAGSPRLSISPYLIQDLNGNWKYVGNTGTPSTLPYNPTTGSRAVMGLLYIDTVSGNPAWLINSGTYISSSLTGSGDIAQYIPRTTSPSQLPIAAIRLISGTSVLTWDNVYDVRPFLQVIPSGTSSGGSSGGTGLGFVGWDEGTFLGTGTILNVVGSGATLTLSGTVFNLNIPGGSGGGGGIGIMGWDEGIPLGTGTVLNFVGSQVTASISGTVINVNVPGINTGTLDARYLKLDTSNDPLTDHLEITSSSYGQLISSHLGYASQHLYQYATSFGIEPSQRITRLATGGHPQFLYPVYEIRDDLDHIIPSESTLKHYFYSGVSAGSSDLVPIVDINPYAPASTGTAFMLDVQTSLLYSQPLQILLRQGIEMFRVNASGTAYSNGEPLIKEAPINNQSYVRKNAGWELESSQGGQGGISGIVGWDEGIPQGTGTILNVVGSRSVLTVSGTVLNLTISPDPQDNIGVMTYDDTTPIGTGTSLVFGNNLTAVRTGTFVFVDNIGNAIAGLGGIAIQDEGIVQGTGTTLNFVGAGVTATISGAVARIVVSASDDWSLAFAVGL